MRSADPNASNTTLLHTSDQLHDYHHHHRHCGPIMTTLMIATKNFEQFDSKDVIDNRETYETQPSSKDRLPPFQMPTVPMRGRSNGALSDAANLNREDERRKTFGVAWPHAHLDPDVLARTGFYFVGPHDNVKCYFCKVEIGRFDPNDQEVTEHQRWSNNCPLLRRRETQNVPVDAAALERILPALTIDVCGGGVNVRHNTVSEGSFDVVPDEIELLATMAGQHNSAATVTSLIQGPEHPEYAIESARMRSFEDWPKTMRQTPEQLSDAGFFYTMKGDRVKCFSCGGGLRDWDVMDVPWEQHARWFGHCAYLLLVKGQEYVDTVNAVPSDEATLAAAAAAECDVSAEVKASIAAALQPAATPVATASCAASSFEVSASSCAAKLNEARLCKICYSNEYNTAFMPCGHVVACGKCASSVTKCPLCRKPFESVVRVYFS